MKRVVIGDRDRRYCDALALLLGDEQRLEYAGCAQTVDELAELVERTTPDMVGIDARLPGGGVAAAAAAIEATRHGCVLVAFAPVVTPLSRSVASAAGAVIVAKGDPTALIEAFTGAAG